MNSTVNHPPTEDGDSREERRAKDDRTTNRFVLFLLLFGVTGFLGLPLLWISKSFSTKEKILWSIINTLYTTALIALTGLICWWSYLQFKQTFGF